jgi:hypothetical protein
VKTAEQQLAEARASQAAAKTASLIAAIDAPIGSDSPVGPGKVSLLVGGLLGGFIVGLGVVFLTVHPIKHEVVAEESNVAQHVPGAASDAKSPASDRNFNGFAIPKFATPTGSLSVKQALWKLAAAAR